MRDYKGSKGGNQRNDNIDVLPEHNGRQVCKKHIAEHPPAQRSYHGAENNAENIKSLVNADHGTRNGKRNSSDYFKNKNYTVHISPENMIDTIEKIISFIVV